VPRAAETVLLTSLALLAFASNSVLTRLALAGQHIDPASFTLVRLAAGAAVLGALARMQARARAPSGRRDLAGPLALFAYAAPFSFAYQRIGAALGALVLFGVVQMTMIGWGVARGERPGVRTWSGLALAVAGLAALTLPSAARPDPLGMGLMTLAGISWGVYSLRGKSAGDPLAVNARNFLLSVPLAVLVSAATFRSASVHGRGLGLAIVSGAVTSGVGYAIWYRALRGLAATRAAVVQLSVPVIAAAGAVVFLGETASARLMICGAAIIGGVALALLERRSPAPAALAAPSGGGR
jgi:drug/metabolite transporter (DMT)-like permease